MKRTVIHYRNVTDQQVKIIKIENAASESEIRKEFGNAIGNIYFKKAPNYKRINRNDKPTAIRVESSYVVFFIYEGQIMNKQNFSEAIKAMKEAGTILLYIKKDFENRIKKITIKKITI